MTNYVYFLINAEYSSINNYVTKKSVEQLYAIKQRDLLVLKFSRSSSEFACRSDSASWKQ